MLVGQIRHVFAGQDLVDNAVLFGLFGGHEQVTVEVFGDQSGKVLVLGWGSTYGSITSAVEKMQNEGKSVSSAHLRHLNPFPSNLGEVLSNFETVLIPEMNLGQLCTMIRARFLINAVPFSKVKGRPFQIREIVRKVEEYL